ncbi:recombinase family protein [Streptomyces sp. NPDC060064]|uniref:recombinase family protein n=1 Tax=Streptomyces sp. NPDC060064 TaxID=3347049 RepID=UPI0036750168
MTPHDDLPSWLLAWNQTPPVPPAAVGRGLRFAFYGRVSTEDQQDPEASRLWQLGRARTLIEPIGGIITAEYFDIGETRALPWKRRPGASALLAALADPQRGFDAVVIGEPQRAFCGTQFGNTFPLFTHYGVPLSVPEVGGAIDPDNEAHDLIMSVFGGMSKGERNRIKIRVHSAMASQTLIEGRYLGGRPPYGYRLVDLGPHPNPGKAATGRRLHGLEPDPVAAPVVVRIFTEYLRGLGIFAIAEGLTRDQIPSPSAHDPARNSHRDTRAWSKSAVRAILTNPRYTGRQVWNRQHKHESLLDIEDVTLGYTTTLRWNSKDKWLVSQRIAHTPLIDDETFAQAQDILASRTRTGPAHGVKRTQNLYVLRGALTHAVCGRKMQGHWAHDEAYYRCRFPEEYALANHIQHPRNVYLRETWILPPLDDWLSKVFLPHRLDDTIDLMAGAAPLASDEKSTAEAARTVIADCDAKLATHRAALEAGADPALVTQWIAETQARKARAVAELRTATHGPGSRMPRDEIARLVRSISDLAAVVRQAEAADKAEIYRQLGLALNYDSGKQKVLVEMNLNQHSGATRGLPVGVRGGT